MPGVGVHLCKEGGLPLLRFNKVVKCNTGTLILSAGLIDASKARHHEVHDLQRGRGGKREAHLSRTRYWPVAIFIETGLHEDFQAAAERLLFTNFRGRQ